MKDFDEHTREVTPSDAKRIEETICGRGGTISRTGIIEGGPTLYTEELLDWLNKDNANFWIHRGSLEISNWPRTKEKEFKVMLTGNIQACEVEEAIRERYQVSVSDVKVEEKYDS